MLRRKSFLRLIHLMLCVFLLLGFHSRALFRPGDYYFDLESDGMRTYYVMMYHTADLSAPDFKFRGMNYPFGENLNYMDALPLVTVLFRAGGRMGWQMPSIPGFLNLTMLLSIPIASILLLEILFRYARPSLLSVIFALGTAFTMPQIHRIYHHFGLGFLFVIPLFWFLFLKMREADKSLSGKGKVTASSVIFRLFIVFLTIAAAFVHFYYAFFSAILIGFLTAMNRTSWRRRALDFFVLAAIPMGIVRLLLFLSGDGRTDRISRPYGSFGRNYYSSPGDIFLPNYKSTFWEIAWRPWHLGTWEGEAFVGFAVIFILFIFIYFARRKKREGTLKKRIFQSFY